MCVELELARNEESTWRQTRWAVKCLTDWLEQQEIKLNFANVSKDESLAKNLWYKPTWLITGDRF